MCMVCFLYACRCNNKSIITVESKVRVVDISVTQGDQTLSFGINKRHNYTCGTKCYTYTIIMADIRVNVYTIIVCLRQDSYGNQALITIG